MNKHINTAMKHIAMKHAASNSNQNMFKLLLNLVRQGKHQEADKLAEQYHNRHGANNATYTRVPQLRR